MNFVGSNSLQFYKFMTPLISRLHRHLAYEAPERPDYSFTSRATSVALTVDEFTPALRNYPIVFGGGDDPMPRALLGGAAGRNQFVDEDGNWERAAYIPAYVRRYPFLLAKLDPQSDEMTLCFDGACAWLCDRDEGNLFTGDEDITDTAREILDFCQRYEAAVARTKAFVAELREADLLVEAQFEGLGVALEGYQIVSEDRLRQLRGDALRRLMVSGAQAQIFAHLFSLRHLEHFAPPVPAMPVVAPATA